VQVNHTPDVHNTTSHIFNFNKENESRIETLLKKYPDNYKKSAVIPMLFMAQEQNQNFLSLSAMNKVAEILEIPPIDVYEVASFYTMFNRTKVGRFHLQVCGTTPCMVRGAEKIIKALEDHLNIRLGETTPDMLFTISEVECLGACVNAPMLQVNNQWVYEDLDEKNVIELIEKFKSGSEVKLGPQNHRNNSEGPLGRTSLKDLEWVVEKEHHITRDFSKAKSDWEKAKEEAAKVAQAQAQAKVAPPTQATPPPATPAQASPPTPTPVQVTPKPSAPVEPTPQASKPIEPQQNVSTTQQTQSQQNNVVKNETRSPPVEDKKPIIEAAKETPMKDKTGDKKNSAPAPVAEAKAPDSSKKFSTFAAKPKKFEKISPQNTSSGKEEPKKDGASKDKFKK
jgi:NADH dehydrogenase (ubiquinone) flavoprotein 2